MNIISNDRMLLAERYRLVQEVNLFDKQPLLDAIKAFLRRKNVTDQNIIDWFNTQYVRWYISPHGGHGGANGAGYERHTYRDGEPDWARGEVYDFNALPIGTLEHIVDYFDQLSPLDRSKINKETYDVVENKVKEWDKKLAASKTNNINRGTAGTDYLETMKFPDGFSIVMLKSPFSYKCEGDDMGHCVGGYAENKSSVIYSLRDPQGAPHATIEYRKTGGVEAIVQIKGKQNTAPVEKYWPYIKQFILDNNLVVQEDGENVGMVQWSGRYYFEESEDWKEVYDEYIVPAQQVYIEKIHKLVTFAAGRWLVDVNFPQLFFKELPDFTKIKVGNFSCANNRLKTLEGAPQHVDGQFYCYRNLLTSLVGAPRVVYDTFSCHENLLTTLEFAPESLQGHDKKQYGPQTHNGFFCSRNRLHSLMGAPQSIPTGAFVCNSQNHGRGASKLTSLEGGPQFVGSSYDCARNSIDTLVGGPVKVGKNFNVSDNKLSSFDGMPENIGENFNISGNNFKIRSNADVRALPPEIRRRVYGSFIYDADDLG